MLTLTIAFVGTGRIGSTYIRDRPGENFLFATSTFIGASGERIDFEEKRSIGHKLPSPAFGKAVQPVLTAR